MVSENRRDMVPISVFHPSFLAPVSESRSGKLEEPLAASRANLSKPTTCQTFSTQTPHNTTKKRETWERFDGERAPHIPRLRCLCSEEIVASVVENEEERRCHHAVVLGIWGVLPRLRARAVPWLVKREQVVVSHSLALEETREESSSVEIYGSRNFALRRYFINANAENSTVCCVL